MSEYSNDVEQQNKTCDDGAFEVDDQSQPTIESTKALSRREFLKASAATGAALGGAALFGHLGTNFAFAQGAAIIKVGVVGCGGRGTGAAGDCANAAPGVVIHALGDVFQNRLDGARKNLSDGLKEKMQVTDDRCFVGFDAYQRVINSGVDLVILATPPGFRPMHVRAAVDAGKHVFMEKPVAVDPVGVRSILASAEIAAQKISALSPAHSVAIKNHMSRRLSAFMKEPLVMWSRRSATGIRVACG
jgi:hypothetical protein